MNQLVIRNKAQEFVFRFLGGLLLFSVGLQLFVHNPKSAVFWILVVVFVLAAILLFTLNFGALINRITADQGILTIRWNTKLFKKHLRIDEITSITEDKRSIRITTKNGHTVRLPVRLMEPDKRNEVRIFLKSNTGL
jgi:hypothetical protein